MRNDDVFLDEGTRRWIAKTAVRSMWRIGAWYSVEDLIQDGYMVYYRCLHSFRRKHLGRRRPTSEDRRRFMGLLKVSFANHITTMANKQSVVLSDGSYQRMHELAASQLTTLEEDNPETYLDSVAPAQPEEATFAVLLAQAPPEVAALIRLLMSDGAHGLAYLRTRLRRRVLADGAVRFSLASRRVRETTNEHFCRLLGLDPMAVDVVEMVRAHFSENLTKGS